MKQELMVVSSNYAKIPESSNLEAEVRDRAPLAKTQITGGAMVRKERRQDLVGVALHRFLLELVGLVFDVELKQLLSSTRGRKETALARQVAMYLAHTTGGLSLSGVGRLFARDRTTVSHACALVEDARDEQVFDRTLSHLESTISCQMELFRHFNHKELSL